MRMQSLTLLLPVRDHYTIDHPKVHRVGLLWNSRRTGPTSLRKAMREDPHSSRTFPSFLYAGNRGSWANRTIAEDLPETKG